MNADWYTKSVEQLMMEGGISVYFKGYRTAGVDSLGQPLYKTDSNWWGAYSAIKYRVNGEGSTPRDAIIDLYKKLS